MCFPHVQVTGNIFKIRDIHRVGEDRDTLNRESFDPVLLVERHLPKEKTKVHHVLKSLKRQEMSGYVVKTIVVKQVLNLFIRVPGSLRRLQ